MAQIKRWGGAYEGPAQVKQSGTRQKSPMAYQLLCIWGLLDCVPVGIHQQLRVAVQVNEAFEMPMVLNKVHHRFHLHFRIGVGAMVHFRARVITRPFSCGGELISSK